MLDPLKPYRRDFAGSGMMFRQIEDERIPFMAFLSLERPGDLMKGEFVRLAFADGNGQADTLPYSTAFLKDFENNHCYDRFWDTITRGHKWMRNRFLCSGYGFVYVGDTSTRFFMNKETGAHAHFRHHYFQMGLIVHFHRAALLCFSDKLSNVAYTLKKMTQRVVRGSATKLNKYSKTC